MRPGRALIVISVIASLSLPAFAAGHKRHTTRATAHRASRSHATAQRSIDDARASEIQQALIKAGYLSGTPSGHWDSASVAAMTKLQADNGWQTKLVPDSRALIKLGLGPVSRPEPPTGDASTASIEAPGSRAAVQ
ncbi:MAG TPA: peptidoglycan-binding domain-containing protein [Acidobacteriaceae bacterium]|nr:peptidoglycan-binding domain-containing protein [Acidobacteriaceae bacterium]